MLIDSHCHLNHLKLDSYENGLDDVLKNAMNRGVDNILTIATTLEEVDELKELSKKYPEVFYSTGVHPSEWDCLQPTMEDIVLKAKDKRCIAIGETGLDYFYNDKNTIKLQQDKFKAHIKAAIELKKPLIIHSRAAKNDTMAILKTENAQNCGGVLHCFTEDLDMAKQALDLGFYISFSGIVTFKNATELKVIAKKIPINRILVETDAPYLTPMPNRGKPNYPEYVYYVAKYIAELRGVNFIEFAKQTSVNAKKLFDFSQL